MKKNRVKGLLALGLSLTMMISTAGCGKEQQLNAEINPDTPVSEVQFPLKETEELSFITSAPATSTQDPNERVISSDWKNRQMFILTGPVLYPISFQIKRIWLWLSLEICRMVCLMQV